MAGPLFDKPVDADPATRDDRFVPSRRTLLGALAVVPIAPLPLAGATASDWQRAVDRWRQAEAALAPVRRRFDAAERQWFAACKGRSERERRALAVSIGLDQAEHDHTRHADRCAAALDALLDTRAPDLAAVIWKLVLVTDMLGSDVPEHVDFLRADLLWLDPHNTLSAAAGDNRHAER